MIIDEFLFALFHHLIFLIMILKTGINFLRLKNLFEFLIEFLKLNLHLIYLKEFDSMFLCFHSDYSGIDLYSFFNLNKNKLVLNIYLI